MQAILGLFAREKQLLCGLSNSMCLSLLARAAGQTDFASYYPVLGGFVCFSLGTTVQQSFSAARPRFDASSLEPPG